MADPASIVGTAVGVLSLGIQVCQGLVSYYEKWKSFDDDIAHFHASIDGLRITLENLECTLPKFKNSSANIVADVEKKIIFSINGIRKLEEVLYKCNSSVSANITQQRGYRLVQKTFYPFKKATLQELSNNVMNLEHNLTTSLHSLTLDAIGDQHQLVVSNSRVAQEEMREVKHAIRSLNANMEVIQEGIPEILQRTDAIQNAALNISSTLKTRLERTCQPIALPELKNYMETLPQMIENRVIVRLDDHIKQIVEIFQTPQLTNSQRSAKIQKNERPVRTVQARLLEKPSLLRDICDKISRNGDLVQLSSIRESQPLSKRPTCTCRLSTCSVEFYNPHRLNPWRRWSARLTASTLGHRNDCELFKYFEKETSWNLKLMCYGGVIAQVVKASIHLRRGAGGFSLSPSLSCIRVVSYDSPAFKLIDARFGVLSFHVAPMVPAFDVVIRKLRGLFQDGRASPHDVNPSGESLIHAVFIGISLWSPAVVASNELGCFLEKLCRLGVPLNEVNDDGKTFLDEMEMAEYGFQGLKPENIGLSQRMLSLGAEYVNLNAPYSGWRSIFWYAVKAAKITEFAEATNLNEICTAVISRSGSRLIAAIENDPDQINKPSFLQLRPLHLSVEWPYGIEVLLAYGADVDVTDQMGFDPVAHAIIRACSKSLELFDTAGWVFLICERVQLAMKLEKRASPFDRSARARTVNCIIKMEANRRRKLQSLLIDYLPENVYRSLSFCEGALLDEQASIARNALERHNVPIPAFLTLVYDHGTIYHHHYLTVRILDVFWEAGFRDVNGLDWTGHTPLMSMTFKDSELEEALEILAWFESKGVDIHEKVNHLHQNSRTQIDSESRDFHRNLSHTVLHYICCNLPYDHRVHGFPFHIYSGSSVLSKGAQVLVRRIVSSKIRDACICACSSGGCQALHMMLKSDFQNSRGRLNSFPSLCRPNDTTVDEIFSEAVRLWTFEKLGLTHTCCRKRMCNSHEKKFLLASLDQEEIDEIQEEEREDLELLEDLLIEFDQQWKQTEDCLRIELMSVYWQTRMETVLSKRKPMDFDKIRDMGVVLHECVEI